jgi:hypothetical protein
MKTGYLHVFRGELSRPPKKLKWTQNGHRRAIPADFGIDLQFALAGILTLPAANGFIRAGSRAFDEGPALVLRCPDAMVVENRQQGGSQAQLATIIIGGTASLGVALAYSHRHVAVAAFDLGDRESQELMLFAAKAGELRMILRGESDSALIAPPLDSGGRDIVSSSTSALSMSGYMDALITVDLAGLLRKRVPRAEKVYQNDCVIREALTSVSTAIASSPLTRVRASFRPLAAGVLWCTALFSSVSEVVAAWALFVEGNASITLDATLGE